MFWKCFIIANSPSLSERRRYCVARRPSVTLSRCVCIRRNSLGGEGNALYLVLVLHVTILSSTCVRMLKYLKKCFPTFSQCFILRVTTALLPDHKHSLNIVCRFIPDRISFFRTVQGSHPRSLALELRLIIHGPSVVLEDRSMLVKLASLMVDRLLAGVGAVSPTTAWWALPICSRRVPLSTLADDRHAVLEVLSRDEIAKTVIAGLFPLHRARLVCPSVCLSNSATYCPRTFKFDEHFPHSTPIYYIGVSSDSETLFFCKNILLHNIAVQNTAYSSLCVFLYAVTIEIHK